MTDYRIIEARLADTLGLPRRPVAVTFRETPPVGVPKFTGTEPSGCSFWRIAAGGRAFFTVASDHYNCPIGSYTHHLDRKSTRLNSSHSQKSYAVFCLEKKKKITHNMITLRVKRS